MEIVLSQTEDQLPCWASRKHFSLKRLDLVETDAAIKGPINPQLQDKGSDLGRPDVCRTPAREDECCLLARGCEGSEGLWLSEAWVACATGLPRPLTRLCLDQRSWGSASWDDPSL